MNKCFTKRNRLSEEIKAGVTYLAFGLMLVICLTSGFYLFSVTQGSQMGYSFKQTELEKELLERANENLKVKVLEASSYEEISSSNIVQNMENANPDFFESRDERLTKK